MASSSAGRRSQAYRDFRTYIQQARPPCWLNSGPWCTGVGLTVEHDPPLSSAPSVEAWEQLRANGRATWRGACQPCQSRQGAGITNGRNKPDWTF